MQLYGVDPVAMRTAASDDRRAGPRRPHRHELRLPRPQGHPPGRRRGAAVQAAAVRADRAGGRRERRAGARSRSRCGSGSTTSTTPTSTPAGSRPTQGAVAVALHARTAAQRYSGTADWSAIARLREHVPVEIPVLGNGDIFSAADALDMVAATGCDGVVVGRGCLGRPWLFGDLEAAFAGRPLPDPPNLGRVDGDAAPARRAAVRAHGPGQGHPRHAQAHRLVPQGLPGRPGRPPAPRHGVLASTSSTSCWPHSTPTSRSRPRPTARAGGRDRRAGSCCPSTGWTTPTTRPCRSRPSWSTRAAEHPGATRSGAIAPVTSRVTSAPADNHRQRRRWR